MKKTLLSTALVAVMAAVAFAPTAQATDGTITFNGKITTSTCTINNGTPSFAVQLPTVATSALSTAGAVAGITPFSVALTGCTVATAGNISAYFTGTGVQSDGNLKNSAATNGVEVQLLNSGSTVMDLSKATAALQGSSTAAVTTSSTSATLNYFAQYYAPAVGVTPGTVTSQVAYTVIYP